MQCVNYSLNNLYIGLFSLKRAPSSLKYCLHTSYLTKTQDTEVHKYFSYRTELINKRSLLFSAICVWRQYFCSFYQLFIGCHKLSWLVVIQRQVLSFEQGIHVYVVTSGRGFTGVLEAQLLEMDVKLWHKIRQNLIITWADFISRCTGSAPGRGIKVILCIVILLRKIRLCRILLQKKKKCYQFKQKDDHNIVDGWNSFL